MEVSVCVGVCFPPTNFMNCQTAGYSTFEIRSDAVFVFLNIPQTYNIIKAGVSELIGLHQYC